VRRTTIGWSLALVAALVAVAGCSGAEPLRAGAWHGPPGTAAPCDFGATRESRPLRSAFVLGCGRAPDGTRLELVTDDGSCLVVQGLPGGERACGVAPARRDPAPRSALSGAVFARLSPRARAELYGETRADVQRVVARYRFAGRVRRRRAAVIEARDVRGLRAAALREPFGYFVVFVPAAARRVVVTGYRGRRRLGSLRFDPILRSLHPRAFVAHTDPD
jgi:hypothetical protein